tara:strand:- start:972 stop:1265 length:294 start_codon:yes stop_codon:yes gene_type:complete
MITLKSDNLVGYLGKLPSEVLLIFASPLCAICKEVVPKIEEKLGDTITLLYIDGDQWDEISEQYNIDYYPTVIYLIDGEEKKRIARVNSKTINKILK